MTKPVKSDEVVINVVRKDDYTKFNEWVNNCPVKVLNYEDNTDTVTITLSLPYPEEE
tara:strand:+ start:355 stop:525 length:171 start_codon:yes stop_codon:yes gene_type:complete